VWPKNTNILIKKRNLHRASIPKASTNSLIVTDWSLGYKSAKPFLDRCSIQGKSNMAFKIIPIERKQSIQIGILEKLAVCPVAFLIPASALTGLIMIKLTS
jgi:hypothetical protein